MKPHSTKRRLNTLLALLDSSIREPDKHITDPTGDVNLNGDRNSFNTCNGKLAASGLPDETTLRRLLTDRAGTSRLAPAQNSREE